MRRPSKQSYLIAFKKFETNLIGNQTNIDEDLNQFECSKMFCYVATHCQKLSVHTLALYLVCSNLL